MDFLEFVSRRVFHQLSQLRGTGDSITVNVGEAYYQLASYEGDQLLAEISSNQFLPHGAGLDGLAQKRLLELGFEPPSEDWPNWNIRVEVETPYEIKRMATSMGNALIDCLEGDGTDLLRGVVEEYLESHPHAALDAEWTAMLVGTVLG